MYNRIIYELSLKKRKDLTSKEKEIIKEELSKYKKPNIPIYPYVKRNEVYFEIWFDTNHIRGYEEYDDAYDDYRLLVKGKVDIKTLKKPDTQKKKEELITLDDGYRRMLDKHNKQYEKGELKYSSYTKKDSTIRMHILPYFDKKPIVKISKADIAHFVDHILYEEVSYRHKKGEVKKLSPYMQKEVLMYFKALYKETKRWFGIETVIDIDYEVEMPKLFKARRQYRNTVSEIIGNEYKENLKKIYKSIEMIENGIFNPVFGIKLLIECTGMRIDEVIALRISKYDSINKTLLIDSSICWHPNKERTRKSYEETTTKTENDRTIKIANSIARYLDKYLEYLRTISLYEEDMYIFSRLQYSRTKEGMLDPFSLKTFNNHIRQAYELVGLINEENDKPYKNHIARHSFNTLLKNNHIEEYDRKEYIGHSNGISVNEGYTHKSIEEENRIVEVAEKYCLELVGDLLRKYNVIDENLTEISPKFD